MSRGLSLIFEFERLNKYGFSIYNKKTTINVDTNLINSLWNYSGQLVICL